MKIIFTKNDGKAQVDDIKSVKSGYFRYLVRYNKAKIATEKLIAESDERRKERIRKMEELKKEAQKLVKELECIELVFTEKSDGSHLYGSITEADIIEKMKEVAKLELKKDQVRMAEHIKEIGVHQIKIHLAEGVYVHIKTIVKNEDGLISVEKEESKKE